MRILLASIIALLSTQASAEFSGPTTTTPLLNLTGSTMPTNGMYLPAANTVGIAANSVDALRLNTIASGVDYIAITPSAAAGNPSVAAAGSDTNIILAVNGKGASGVRSSITSSGTTAPFSVYSLRNLDATVNNGSGLSFQNSSTVSVANISAVNETQTSSGTGRLMFFTYNAGTGAERLRITSNGHFQYSGTAPGTLTGCGTGATIAGNDNRGRVTIGTTPGASCTFTFAGSWPTAPVCRVQNETTSNIVRPSPTTTTLVMTGTLTASDVVSYACDGY